MTIIESKIAYELCDPENPFRRFVALLGIRYDDADPFVMTLVFPDEEKNDWEIGREIIAAGLVTLSGVSDVRVYPTHIKMKTQEAAVAFELHTPYGEAKFLVARRSLQMFLDRTYELVAQGAEEFDADELIGAIFPS